MKILIIEDNKSIAHSLRQSLERDYTTDLAHSGKKGSYKALTNVYDLIMLDLGLPDADGLEICQHLRQEEIKTPILILTAKESTTSKIILLNAGADDYVTKPFDILEIKARIRALLRRKGHLESKILQVGELSLHQQTKTALFRHQPLKLSKKEFFILEYFLLHPNQVLNRLQLAEHIWERNPFMTSNTIDVHICNLRNKIDPILGKQLIKTVHGDGYLLVSDINYDKT